MIEWLHWSLILKIFVSIFAIYDFLNMLKILICLGQSNIYIVSYVMSKINVNTNSISFCSSKWVYKYCWAHLIPSQTIQAQTLATNLQNCRKVLDLVKSQSHRWASVKSLETLYLTGATKSALMFFSIVALQHGKFPSLRKSLNSLSD